MRAADSSVAVAAFVLAAVATFAAPVAASDVTVSLTVPAASGGSGSTPGSGGAPLPQPTPVAPTTTAPIPEPDVTPPAAVSGLAIASGDGQLVLTWRNPADGDLAAVAVVRRSDRFPVDPSDGVTLQRAVAERAVDSGLANGRRYYYGVFTVDASGNVGPGALAAGIPLEPAQPGQPQPPLPPSLPDLPPVPEAERIHPRGVQLLANSSRTVLVPGSDGTVGVLADGTVTVVLPSLVLSKPVAQVVVVLGSGDSVQMFTLPRRPDGGFAGTFTAPGTPGSYQLSIRVRYRDGTEDSISRPLAVVARGVVADGATGQPLGGGVAILWQRRAGRWQVWSDGVNPQLTGADGTFGFVPGSGEYQLEVLRAGYWPWRRSLAAERGVVAAYVALVPEGSVPTGSIPRLPAAAVPLALAMSVVILAWQLRQMLRG